MKKIIVLFFVVFAFNEILSAQCDFAYADCSGSGVEKSVVVLDSLRIMPRSAKICAGDVFNCTTDSQMPVHWTVTKGDSLVFDTTGVAFSFRFGRPGSYRVQANSGSHCNTAVCAVNVKGRPEKPTGIRYPAHACPNSAVLLSARPSAGNYIEWRSAWGGTYPNQIEGDTVSIGFGDTIATLLAFQVDRELGCRSDSIIIKIDEFYLAPLSQDTVRICQGQTVYLSVADQSDDGVLYNWWVDYPKYATIKTDNRVSYVSILANYTNQQIPYTTTLFLRRKSCRGDTLNRVTLLIGQTTPPTINVPDPVCQHSSVFITMDNAHEQSGSVGQCHWNGGGSAVGLGYWATFEEPGQQLVTLHYVSEYGCQPVNTETFVEVHPYFFSHLDIESNPGYICMVVDGNVSGNVNYLWNTGATTQCIPYESGQGYSCTAYVGDNPCPTEASMSNDPPPPPQCPHTDTVPGALSSIMECFNSVHFSRNNQIPQDATDLFIESQLTGEVKHYDFNTSSLLVRLDTLGPYKATINWRVNDVCYTSVTKDTVKVLPRIVVKYNCVDSLIIYDSSEYYMYFPLLRIVNVYDGENQLLLSRSLTPQMHRIAIPTNGLSEGEEINIALRIGTCNYHMSYTFHEPPRNVTITARDRMCTQTPFFFSGNAQGTGLEYRWDFGDGSYNYGNDIWHVFDDNTQDPTIRLIVTDNQGCFGSAVLSVYTKDNPFEINGIDLRELIFDNTNYPVCSGMPIKLVYNSSIFNNRLPLTNTRYVWTPQSDTTFGDSNYVTNTGSYFVLATDTLYLCKGADRKDFRFLNTPKADIRHKQFYCQGDVVNLLGNAGSQYQYEWTVTSPSANTASYSTANVSFDADETGVWKAELKVSMLPGTSSCWSMDSVFFSVVEPPSAPVIEYVDNECITEGPISLRSGDGDNLIWSNGTYGTNTVYYYDGLVSAFRIDPHTGCKSPSAQIVIPEAPRFDALMTGCYELCYGQQGTLDLYTLGTNINWWKWMKDDESIVNQGQTLPCQLSVGATNNYSLVVSYGNDCESTSPDLIIEGVDCEEDPARLIKVIYDKIKLTLDGCKVSATLSFFFENLSDDNYTFTDMSILPSQTNYSWLPSSVAIPAHGSSGIVTVDVEFNDLSKPIVLFVLSDGTNILGHFAVDLLEWIIEQGVDDGCYFGTNMDVVYDPTRGSPGHSVYFDFEVYPSVPDVLMVWSDEGEIIHTNYDPALNLLKGQMFIDYGKLSQLSYADSCVHFHMLVCQKDELCISDTCIDVDRMMERLLPLEYQSQSKAINKGLELESGVRYTLKPNPATGIVTVIDVANRSEARDVVRIEVYTLDGRKEMLLSDKVSFDVQHLPNAAYIVRIVSKDGKKEYVKLIKM